MVVTATVVDASGATIDSDQKSIVIGGTAGSVVVGGGTVVGELDPATYSYPMSVLVADTNGNAISGAVVTLSVWPAFYANGYWLDTDIDPSPDQIVCAAQRFGAFPNEDINENLTLDAGENIGPNEDLNNNGIPDSVTYVDNGVTIALDEDLNGNGQLDTAADEDINGNRILDAVEDLDGDGFLDTNEDLNNNGALDSGEDLNGNLVLDARVTDGQLTPGNSGGKRRRPPHTDHRLQRGGILQSGLPQGPRSLDQVSHPRQCRSLRHRDYRYFKFLAPGGEDRGGRLSVAGFAI